jgi:hypothetical protein
VLTLPAVNAEEQSVVEQLVADCQPATFGRGGKDVYDESYRKAGALGIDEYVLNWINSFDSLRLIM